MTIETFERILGEHPFFQGLAAPQLQTLVGCASNVPPPQRGVLS